MFGRKKHVDKKEMLVWGIASGVAQVLYVLVMVLFLTYMGEVAHKFADPPHLLAFFFMLLLFVFSVAASGFIVFAYPAYLALKNRLLQAIFTLLTTLVTIFVGLIGVLMVILIFF